MKVALRPEAEADLEDAAQWYERQRRGLGGEFLDEVLHTLQAIEDRPRKTGVRSLNAHQSGRPNGV